MKHEIYSKKSHKPWAEGEPVGSFLPRVLFVAYGKPHPGHCHHVNHLTIYIYGAVHVICKRFKDPMDETSLLLDEWSYDVLHFPWIVELDKDVWHQHVALSKPGSQRICITALEHALAAGVPRDLAGIERLPIHG